MAQTNWSVTAGHSLVWAGNRETLAGLRIEGTPDAVASAIKAGFKDLCVDLSAGVVNGALPDWQPTLDALAKANARYLVAVGSLAPLAEAYEVDPEGYRVTGITTARHISVQIPGANSVFAVLATSADGTIQWSKRVATPDGKLELDVDPANDLDHILLIYPRLTGSNLIDCWDGLDQHRDHLLAILAKAKLGAGCRGIVNPLGASAKLFGGELDAVPTSHVFQLQFQAYLEARYKNVDATKRTWSMRSNGLDTFARLARLVPLWYGLRGLPQMWDPVTDELFEVDSHHSLAWDDYHSAILAMAGARIRHLTEVLRQETGLPVIQEWNGWSIPYEGSALVDGIGLVTNGSAPSTLLEEAGRGASSLVRWSRPGWLIASRIQGLEGATATEMKGVAEDLQAMGARGFFLSAEAPEARKRWAEVVQALNASNSIDESSRPLFFPENAYNPALPQALPGGVFWLPSPEGGDRLDYGTLLRGYSVSTLDGIRTVIWTPGPTVVTKLRLIEPKRAVVRTATGELVPTRVGKDFIELALSSTPVIITGLNELPAPVPAIDETTARVTQLLDLAESKHGDVTQSQFVFNDGVSSLDRTPGAGYLSMRKAYKDLSRQLADYTWIEAESVKSPPLGEPIDRPGCSNGRALVVRSHLSLPGAVYRLNYPVSPRTTGEQEVWIALKGTAEERSKVRVLVGSQSLALPAHGLSDYADGFAWYRCGVTRLGPGRSGVAIELDGSAGIDVQIDAVLLTPRAFTPNGVELPDAIVFAQKASPRPRRKG
jgi:hypothetical protein